MYSMANNSIIMKLYLCTEGTDNNNINQDSLFLFSTLVFILQPLYWSQPFKPNNTT